MNETALSFLLLQGYSPCDIAACNCGSFHGGNAHARLSEIHGALGWERTQGKTALRAIQELVARAEGRRDHMSDKTRTCILVPAEPVNGSEGVVVEIVGADFPGNEMTVTYPEGLTVRMGDRYRLTRIEDGE